MTGLRIDEALTLINADVDLAAGRIGVRQSKSDAGYRSVPIAPELRPHIDAWLAFVKRRGGMSRGAFLVRATFAMKPRNVEHARADRRARRPHAQARPFPAHLRSYLLNRGVRLEVVSRLLGHANTAITERAYARLEDATIRTEMLAALR
jgi:integrase